MKSAPGESAARPHAARGSVASLHVHGPKAGAPLATVARLDLVAKKGIANDPRYFDRNSRRQVSLIAREQVSEHAAVLGLRAIHPGIVRSNVETLGIDLVALLGWEVRVGTALLFFYAPRTPCAQMDAIAPGLRKLMGDSRQGVLAQVVESGVITGGDAIEPVRFIQNPRPNLP
jgi:hypothetical protein